MRVTVPLCYLTRQVHTQDVQDRSGRRPPRRRPRHRARHSHGLRRGHRIPRGATGPGRHLRCQLHHRRLLDCHLLHHRHRSCAVTCRYSRGRAVGSAATCPGRAAASGAGRTCRTCRTRAGASSAAGHSRVSSRAVGVVKRLRLHPHAGMRPHVSIPRSSSRAYPVHAFTARHDRDRSSLLTEVTLGTCCVAPRCRLGESAVGLELCVMCARNCNC